MNQENPRYQESLADKTLRLFAQMSTVTLTGIILSRSLPNMVSYIQYYKPEISDIITNQGYFSLRKVDVEKNNPSCLKP